MGSANKLVGVGSVGQGTTRVEKKEQVNEKKADAMCLDTAEVARRELPKYVGIYIRGTLEGKASLRVTAFNRR